VKITVLTLFPEFFTSGMSATLLGKAVQSGVLDFHTVQIRDFALDKHHTVDDTPFGGGSGMVMKPEPCVDALESVPKVPGQVRILLSPRGERLTQPLVKELAAAPDLVFFCGRYEGVDQRVTEFVDREISLGDFVLSGGEPAALAMIDAVARLLPGFMGNANSVEEESFDEGLLEYPQYTRPVDFRGRRVPDVLLSGNHAHIRKWRRAERLGVTRERRPDLLDRASLTPEDQFMLDEGSGKPGGKGSSRR
jgi:tRNA (guanine37-N1)-methyltransferase